MLRASLIDAALAQGAAAPAESIAALCADLEEPRLMGAMVRALLEGGGAAEAGERAVLRIARAASAARETREGFVEVLRAFPRHRRTGVLDAAPLLLTNGVMAYGGRGDALVRWFGEREDPAHVAMRSEMRRSRTAAWRSAAWVWLKRDEVGAAATERLARAEEAEEHEVVLARGHLLANPTRERRVGLITAKIGRGKKHVLPGAEVVPTLSVEARRALPRFVGALRIADGVVEQAFKPLREDPDGAVRHAAMLGLGPCGASGFCEDPDPAIARGAVLRMALTAEGAGEMGRLAGSSDPLVRNVAHEEVARRDPWRDAGDRSRLAARRELAADQGGFIATLRRRIVSGTVAERVNALMLARRLELQREIELELLALVSAPEESVAATAAAALGEVKTSSAVQAATALLGHQAHRVRANAVEAVMRAGGATGPGYASVVELKSDPHHRVRANALRGLLASAAGVYESAAAEALGSMVGDDRPLHRLAGVWAVERVLIGPWGGSVAPGRWNELAARVAEVARRDGEPPVRARAVRCAARLLARMRSGWARRAVGLEGAA